MKVAVTGANGYLGYNVTKSAIKKNWEVNAIVRREEVVEKLQLLGANVLIVKGFDINALKNAFEGCDAIFHFANVVCGSTELFERVNIEGLKKVLEAARLANVSKIIYPSGLGVDRYNEVNWAKNDYFRTKNEAEKIIKHSNLAYIIFRPSYILGPKDELIPEIINQIVDGEVIIAGDGNIPMKPIFLNDAVKAFLLAVSTKTNESKILNLVGPQIVNMNQLVEMVIKQLLKIGFNVPRPKIVHIPYGEAPEKLGVCKDMVDVMQCNLTPNGDVTANELGFELSSLSDAINAAIQAEIGIDSKFSQNKRAIVLLSGGIDSATALYWGIKQGYKIVGLSILYKWRAKNEIKAAKQIAKITNTELIEVPAEFIQQATDLKMEGYPVPSVIGAPQGFIPMKNLLFYSIAAYFAQTYGCQIIIGGHIKPDTKTFPDAKPKFFKLLKKIVNISQHALDKNKSRFLFPFINLNKSQVVKLGNELNVPFELTWSCYGDFEKPCYACKPCITRKNAFLENKMNDPSFNKIIN